MIHLLWPLLDDHKPKLPITLESFEIEGWNFMPSAEQAYRIIYSLFLCNLIKQMPYNSPGQVLKVIEELIDDIDLNSHEWQVNEKRNLRVEFRDALLSIEVFLGV